jgi:PAS domain S-box-containing protein
MNHVAANTADILNTCPDAVIALDKDWHFTYANTKASQVFNLSANKLLGKIIWTAYPEYYEHSFYDACCKAKELQQPQYAQVYLAFNKQWLQINISPLQDALVLFICNITVKKAAEEKLLQSESRLRALIENNDGIISLIDENLQILFRNSSVAKITGFTNEEYDIISGSENIHPADAAYVKGIIAESVKKPALTLPILFRVKHKMGNYIWLEGVITNKINDPDIRGIITNLKDVTKRIEAEEEIKKSSERFRLVTAATNDMIWDWNLFTDELWWNYNYNSLFGYDNQTIHHISSWVNSVHPEDRKRVKDGIYKIIESGEKYWSDEYRYLKKDGTVLFIYDRGYVLYDEGNKPYRMIGSMLNITERINTAKAMEEREEKYRNIFERASDSIVVHDLQGNILDINFSAIGFSGYSKEEMMRMRITHLLFEEDLKILPVPFDKLLAGETTFNRRRVKTKTGVVRIMDVSSKMLPDGNIMAMLKDVTERTAAQIALKNSELRFRTLAANAPAGIFETNIAGETIYVNEKMSEYTGLSFDELLGINWIESVHPEDRKQLQKEWSENVHQKKESSSEYRMLDKHGNIKWISGKAVPVYDKDEQHTGYLGTVFNITKEKMALLALKESEEKYRTLVEQASDGIYIANTAGKIVIVNPNACKLTGYSENELLQMSIYDFVTEADLEKEPFRFEELRQGKTVVIKRKFKIKNGTLLNVECIANMLSDGRILVFARDITERLKAEQALRESEEKYRTLVEQASESIYIADSNGKVATVNSSACRLSGYSEAELLGMSIADIVPLDELQKKPLLFDKLRDGKTVSSQRIIQRKSGELLTVESNTKMLSDGRILSFVHDITDQIQAQNEIIKEKKMSDSIINSLPGIFYLFDKNGNLLRWNKNFEFVSGYTNNEIGNMQPLDFFDEDEQHLVKQTIENVFNNGTADVEAHFFTKYKKKISYYFSGWRLMLEDEPCLIGVGIDITAKKEAEELLQKSYDDIRRLATHLTQVREEERKRIGREIHDELGQQLTAIKMDIAWIDKKTPDETSPIKKNLKNMITLLDGTNQSVRRILTELSPGIIDNDGLLDAITRQNRQFTTTTGKPVNFTTAETKIILPQEIANCIFRVYQESFTNIMRYAEPSSVETSLTVINNSIVVVIQDNGKGFDITAVQAKRSFGILGMRERVLSQRGKFELQSQIGKGTKITVTMPIP